MPFPALLTFHGRLTWLARASAVAMVIVGFLMFSVTSASANGDAPKVVDLGIAKSADRAEAAPGDLITWTVTVHNLGTADVPLEMISVEDPGVTLVRAGEPSSGDVLRPGERLTFTGQTAATADRCPTLSNTATVRLVADGASALGGLHRPVKKPAKPQKRPKKGTKGKPATPKPEKPPVPPPAPPADVNPQNDSSTATVAVTCPPPPPPPPPPPTEPVVPVTQPVTPVACPVPALRIGIVAPRRVRAGRTIQLAVTVHNASPAVAASDVVARYSLPRGTALARLPRGATLVRGRSVVLRLPSLAPGASRTMRLLLRPTARPVHRRGHRAQARERCTATRTAVTVTTVKNTKPRKRVPPVTG